MSLSKKGSRKRLKNKRTNSEAIDKLILQSQLKSKGSKKGNSKVVISEVFSDAKKKKSKLFSNSNLKGKKSKKKLTRIDGMEMFMTVGNNKLIPRNRNLKLTKREMNKLFWNKKTTENLLMQEKVGNHIAFEAKKKSLKILDDIRGMHESLADSGLASLDYRFQSTKKKIGKADFEFNMKRLSNADKKNQKLIKSPETKKKREKIQKQYNVKVRKTSKENDIRIRKKVSLIRRMELELANEINSRKKLKLGRDVLNSVKLEKQLGFKDHPNFFERKSMNYKSQKTVLIRKKDLFQEKIGKAKSKEKQYKRRKSEKDILLKKENTLCNGQRRGGKSMGQKVKRKHEEVYQNGRQNSKSKKSKSRKKKKKEEMKNKILKSEMWGLGKKKLMSMSKMSSKAKRKMNKERLEKEIFKQLGNSKFQSLFKSQRKGTLNKQKNMKMLLESATEKTLNSELKRKNSKKILGKLNFDILSKKKSRKKNLKSLSKIFKNGILKTKKDDKIFLFDEKSKSMKKKREYTMK
jgi:hypothetical protein